MVVAEKKVKEKLYLCLFWNLYFSVGYSNPDSECLFSTSERRNDRGWCSCICIYLQLQRILHTTTGCLNRIVLFLCLIDLLDVDTRGFCVMFRDTIIISANGGAASRGSKVRCDCRPRTLVILEYILVELQLSFFSNLIVIRVLKAIVPHHLDVLLNQQDKVSDQS